MSNEKVLPPVELGKCVEGRSAWEKGRQAFWKMRESLLPKYRNKHVLVYQEQVIDVSIQ